MIRVVCAIIENADGKFLLTQRSDKMDHSFHWEFPGGKVHQGENDAAAIQREIKEELQIEVDCMQNLTSVEWQYPGKKIVLVPIICEIRSGTIELTEHINWMWATLKEMNEIKVLGADREVVKLLKDIYEN